MKTISFRIELDGFDNTADCSFDAVPSIVDALNEKFGSNNVHVVEETNETVMGHIHTD